MKRHRPLLRTAQGFAAGSVVALAVACGGGAKDTSVEVPSQDPEADLERAEQSVVRALGQPAHPLGGSAHLQKQPGTAPPAEPLPPAPVEERAHEPDCESACEALASMRRAAERVCALAGPGDRCDAAKTRLGRAEKRVHEACPECPP